MAARLDNNLKSITRCSTKTVSPTHYRGNIMKATQKLHNLGQSLWLDNITRDLLTSGTLKRYIDELSSTGLTSNPTIFDHPIKNRTAYDAAIRNKFKQSKARKHLFLTLAVENTPRTLNSSQ